jgi:hypothetical protein
MEPKANGLEPFSIEEEQKIIRDCVEAANNIDNMTEKPYQLLDQVREPLPIRPGHTEKVDNEYQRNGTCSIVMFTEPLFRGFERLI